MHALPVVILQGGSTQLFQGTLFRLPPELTTTNQIKHYIEVSKLGWSLCPQGYHVYAVGGSVATKIVIPGISLLGVKNSGKNFEGARRYAFDKTQIENFAASLLEMDQAIQAAKNDEVSLLVHDLRAFSSAIYNSALSAKTAAEKTGLSNFVQDQIETVIATQTMLSIRIDMIDVAADTLSIGSPELIPVYKKIDKVVRCFRPKADARQINISIISPKKSYALTQGPPLLELIAYSIIDNAVKYSPDSATVSVLVEDLSNEVVVKIISLGPRIREDERSKIFRKGFRGDSAQKSGRDGTGIGLSTAADLIDNYFGGSITVHQDLKAQIVQGGVDYFATEFEILVPRYISI